MDKQSFASFFTDRYTFYRDFIKPVDPVDPYTLKSAIVNIIDSIFSSLKSHIEDPSCNDSSWDNPTLSIQYLVPLSSENASWVLLPKSFSAFKEEENFFDNNIIDAFRSLCCDTFLIEEENDKFYFARSKSFKEKISNLSADKRDKINASSYPGTFFSLIFNKRFKDRNTGKRRKTEIRAVVQITPLWIKLRKDEAYYDVRTHLEISGLQPSHWFDADKENFWDLLFSSTSLEHIFEIPESTLSVTFPNSEFIKYKVHTEEATSHQIRSSIHLEKQKFGLDPVPNQMSLWDNLLDEGYIDDKQKGQLELIGLNCTTSQYKAIYALQKLFDKNSYDIPKLKISITDYLGAYGLKPRFTKRGFNEYFSNERSEALKALHFLNDNKFIFVYDRYVKEGGKKETVRSKSSLISLKEVFVDVTDLERESLKKGKSRKRVDYLEIEPGSIFTDQIETNFILKDAGYLDELKLLCPGNIPRHTSLFLDWLIVQAKQCQSKKIPKAEINYMKLARRCRMYSWIESGQTGRIRKALNDDYKIAKKLGYITAYKTVQSSMFGDKEVFTFSPIKFPWVKNILSKKG